MQHPSEFARAVTVTTSGEAYQFGFIAALTRISNDSRSTSLHVTLAGRPATHADFELKAGETLQVPVRCSGVSLLAVGGEGRARVLALGD